MTPKLKVKLVLQLREQGAVYSPNKVLSNDLIMLKLSFKGNCMFFVVFVFL